MTFAYANSSERRRADVIKSASLIAGRRSMVYLLDPVARANARSAGPTGGPERLDHGALRP